MRDIAAEVGMQAGSVYYHFKSKKELLVAIYTLAVEGIENRLLDAISDTEDPWQRLEVAVVTHLETILDRGDYARVMIGVTPDKAEDVAAELVILRDRYESHFATLVNGLPLRGNTDRRLLRLMLLGALNSTMNWYRDDSQSPAEIGSAFVDFLRSPVGQPESVIR